MAGNINPATNNNNVPPTTPGGQTPQPPKTDESCISTMKSYTVDPISNKLSDCWETIKGWGTSIKNFFMTPFNYIYECIYGKQVEKMKPADVVLPETQQNKKFWEETATELNKRVQKLINDKSQDWSHLLNGANPDHPLRKVVNDNFVTYLKKEGVTEQKDIDARVKDVLSPSNRAYFELLIQAFVDQKLLPAPVQK